ncbi:Anion exchange protein 3,Anion exchange protein 4,Sodium bicarbonate cotransporter 3,Sodium-driven chloride bicarbonate exchanger,Electroneutral sodium bicarbonate exchanger 1,Electrogenic sodium bicarbonate cotransporter 1,Electrogenic sodium bicarbonate cotransporter 4 [Mytilus coruscus]|uniref:Anion exchange protein n=1 Tax=Mytilus coruscus TaxID=42192 RepID=A0A6J8DV76_MYTCO|nr:Anion exchange protein 3,Anion exchange protein 4,Sodium bicarbonate cotransporter 3,Sodium-driven chloride bicarbonate exchanger,Electroneutral sodium bicarbonate exchanger 1,Electrogenic sodium bicarbonate cotransporter 1,Electrogenic sodium bicarbonate cotransporter 4 [Mytilus coruscus]
MKEEQATCGPADSISENGEDKLKGKVRHSARFDISENEEFNDMPRERGKRESKISVSDITVERQRRQSIAANIKFRIVNPVRRLSRSVQETLHTYASKRRGSTLHDQPFEYNPTDWVQRIINNNKRGVSHKAHSVFCELDVLRKHNENFEWKESARWVKYEENLEEGGKRWSKPHVASLSMHSLFELRCAFVEGVVSLDHDAHSLSNVIDKLLEEWQDQNDMDTRLRPHLRDIMLAGHKHSHVKRSKASKGSRTLSDISDERSEAERGGNGFHLSSSASLASMDSSGLQSVPSTQDLSSDPTSPSYKPNLNFMRKIPKDAEAANVMVGEVEELEQRLVGFMRLKEPRLLGDVTEVALPSRFVCFMFGPKGSMTQLMELGRCISTMMVDEIFRELAYKCLEKEEFLAGVDEFMEQVTVLPPGEWDPKIRLEPPSKVPSQNFRKNSINPYLGKLLPAEDEGGHSIDDPALTWSKIPFKGLVDDIKRKVPHYLTDFKDALHIQCFASFVYVFLGTLTPNVTFGGLLGQATDQYMGVMECIFAAAVTGVLFALFGGQPLNILGSTGPMLVLETIIYNLCKDNDWDFMPARFWVGMWTVLFILIIVIFNLSSCVKYITRFTEDSFATLIAVIFIVEAFKKLFEIETNYPVNFNPDDPIPFNCSCSSTCNENVTTALAGLGYGAFTNYTCTGTDNFTTSNMSINWEGLTPAGCSQFGGSWVCDPKQYYGDVFFLSVILFAGTFGITVLLISFKTSSLFPNVIRQRVSDFSVLIAIVSMVLLDYFLGLPTPKLTVPSEFKPTRPGRGWIVSPFSDKNPWWLYLAASVPAALSTILVFLDQQITAVIVNRKEHKLQKGVGYHLDMFVVAITVGIHSLLGLPWYVAATVSALAHVRSLQKESECTAPGEKPVFLGVREQRVTALFIGILSGLAVLITSVLKIIPMPVLYGVFFFMGFSALRGQQFVDRLILFLQPRKYQPDVPYIRHVQLWRIHMFTIIQIICLVLLWVVKSIKAISIAFPLLVLATGIVRKMLECVYTNHELKYIDDVLPGSEKKSHNEDNEKIDVPYKTFSSIDSVSTIVEGKENGIKPSFYVDEECDLKQRTKAQGNTKL